MEDSTQGLNTWENVEIHEEIKKTFSCPACHDGLAKMTGEKCNDIQEEVLVFLDQFIKGYHGSSDSVEILEALIEHVGQSPSLNEILKKLNRLKEKMEPSTYVCDTIVLLFEIS